MNGPQAVALGEADADLVIENGRRRDDRDRRRGRRRAAVDRVNETGGGWAVVGDEGPLATFATPIGARCADCGVREAAERFDAIREALRSLGTTVDEPRLLMQSLTFAGIPALRLSFSGYLDVFGLEVVGLAPDP